MVFFLLTGIGIQFYTNPGIFQPRERDYSLVGSFFIFTLWIGIGVSALYKEAENLFRSTGIETSLLLDSRLDAIAQATIDENPFKVCERFMGFRLKTSIINAGKNADTNLQYMANWKKKSALRMADYICQHRTLEPTDAQLERLYNDIVLITKQEGVERYVDDYAIESSLFEIAEAAGVIAFKRKQNGTCQILD